MNVSIIIINYKTYEYTKNVIESVFEKTEGIEYEVILIDNASPDNSGKLLKEYFGDRIKYIQNNENMGFGRANNEAAKIAKGEYFLFLNSDVILKNNAVYYFYDFAKNNKKYLLGSYLLNENNEIIHSYDNFTKPLKSIIRLLYYSYLWLYKIRFLFSDNKYSIKIKPIKRVDYICGANLFIKKNIFYELHGFDENIFMYFEDDDLCRRANNKGYFSYIISGPEIIHLEETSFKNINNKLLIKEKSFIYYLSKYYLNNVFFIIKMYLYVYTVIIFLSPYRTYKEKVILMKMVLNA